MLTLSQMPNIYNLYNRSRSIKNLNLIPTTTFSIPQYLTQNFKNISLTLPKSQFCPTHNPLDQSSERFTMQKNRRMESISYRVCITAFALRVTPFHITQRIIEFGIFSSPFLVQMTTNIVHPRRT